MKCNPCPDPLNICSCILHPDYVKRKKRQSRANTYDEIEKIAKQIAEENGFTLKEFKSKSRKQFLSRCRNKAIRRCREETSATLQEIGDFFNRNHATIIYAIGGKNEQQRDSRQFF